MKKWLAAVLALSVIGTFSGCAVLDAFPQISTNSSNQSTGNSESDKDNSQDGLNFHADNDGDGICEHCNASIETELEFFALNDLHGKFDDTYANIGVDEMTTYLRNAQKQSENVVLLSSGDMWQGSAESNFTKGNIITDWMNDLQFASMTMGNHEFDWGESYIEANEAMAQFPFLGINIYDKDTNQRVEYCDASVVIERSGVKIGIIGAIGDCYSSIADEQVKDIYFKVGDELTELVKEESTRLRAQGADIIVYSLHDSENSNFRHYDIELSDGYVDLVFEGHSHSVVKEQDAHGVWHLQAGGDNSRGISYAKLRVNILTGEVDVPSAKLVSHSTYENGADDPIVDELLEKYADELAKINENLGNNDRYRDSDTLANFMARALYEAGVERWGNESKYEGKIVLGGGYINVRSPYYLPAGQITYGDIYPLFTFDNPVVLCAVSGSRLKSQFINSNNYYCYYGDDGQAIKNNVDDNATYYVVVDTYCANYDFRGMGFLQIVEYYDEARQFFSRDALANYIKAGGLTDGASTELPSVDSIDGLTDIAELLTIGEALSDNAETAEKYRVKGTIISVAQAFYGNMTIEDEYGNQLYIYGTWETEGVRYGQMSNPPTVGDTVVLEGVMKKYVPNNGTPLIEMIDGVFLARGN